MDIEDFREAVKVQREFEECRRDCRWFVKDGLVVKVEHSSDCNGDSDVPDIDE